MSATVLETATGLETPTATLSLRGGPDPGPAPAPAAEAKQEVEPAQRRSKFLPAPGPDYKYARFLPSYDHDLHLPPLEPFEHVDPGHAALKHENPREFLEGEGKREVRLTPKIGSEVHGVQLSQLDERAKSQLALFVAQRGVVVFRDQDFIDQDPEWQLHSWGSTFGRLHIHPTSGQPAEFPEFHLVYREASAKKTFISYYADRLSTTGWHSDVTYELQPPGLTTLFLYDSPDTGGDTVYVSQTEAYNRLSPSFRAYLETLTVIHSGVEQAEFSRRGNRGGVVKREPVETEHPLVRRHPVTGEKALFVNKQFSTRIVGLKYEESEAILNLLYTHIAQGQDFQVRAKWEPRTVVLWDNRVTAHSATGDYDPNNDGFRHGTRITPQAERPFI
ncbi:hypothetical protein L198_05185 [Cryptococcus wingfieldii CBS 7118]|uniref:Laminin IV type B domain-containing protein n=1 Tax=Cryptococcus wingfieldii CBS 7118 TaxID=1295528 RepID=A0A1E3J0I5_9TREE|nr:hypothetical protein L198_05185 [Cryptococcus wingfieldii CBS 7118]ODN94328.1 hypothetical protein L198_05185 [Cryptococcus wingfieldii CBS 7118]